MITYRAARRALARNARRAEIGRQVQAALESAGDRPAAEVEAVEAVEVPRSARTGHRMNRHERRVARLRGCLAAYSAAGQRPEHEPAECDGTCRGEMWPWMTADRAGRLWLAVLGVVLAEWRRAWRPPAGCGELRRCECGAHDWHNAPVRSGWRSLLTTEQLAAHDAYFAREQRAWQSLVWLPAVAEERAEVRHAGLRKVAAVAGSAWSRLRAALVSRGVLRHESASASVERHRKLTRWLEVCPHTGPPAVRPGIGSVRVISP